MFRRLVLAALVVVVFAAVVQAKDKTISGVLTKIEPGMVEVRINKKETQSIMLTADTTYERWTLYKRMAIDRHADFHSLKIGTRVRIEIRSDNPVTARKVWIVIT